MYIYIIQKKQASSLKKLGVFSTQNSQYYKERLQSQWILSQGPRQSSLVSDPLKMIENASV